jgi:hypothetical protein
VVLGLGHRNREVRASRLSGQDSPHQHAVDVGEAELAALVASRRYRVKDPILPC